MLKALRRRSLMTAAILAPLGPVAIASPNRLGHQTIPDRDVFKIMAEEAEPISGERKSISSYWFQQPPTLRKLPQWADDSRGYDYFHVAHIQYDTAAFELDATILRRYAELSSFELNPKLPRLLIGIRGCEQASPRSGFVRSQMLREARPDHIHPRCLLGVWDRSSNKFALFKGSTVPVVDHMQDHINRVSRCNMMPTGLHHYRVGAHNGLRQPGAFRQQRGLWVRRANINLVYSLDDPGNIWDDLDGGLPYNNIHAQTVLERTVVDAKCRPGAEVRQRLISVPRKRPAGHGVRQMADAGVQKPAMPFRRP